MVRKVPPSIGKDEIEAAALIGLYQAIIAYDKNKGVSFEVYAPWRIRGAILDELVMIDPSMQVDRDGYDPISINSITSTLPRNDIKFEIVDHRENKPDAVILGKSSYQHILHVLPPDIAEFLDLIFGKNMRLKDIAAINGVAEAYVASVKMAILDTIKRTYHNEDGLYAKIADIDMPFAKVIHSVRKILGKQARSIDLDNLGLVPDSPRLPTIKKCSVVGCRAAAITNGLCQVHHTDKLVNGSSVATINPKFHA